MDGWGGIDFMTFNFFFSRWEKIRRALESYNMRMAGRLLSLFKVVLIPVVTFFLILLSLLSFVLVLEYCSVLSPFDFSAVVAGFQSKQLFPISLSSSTERKSSQGYDINYGRAEQKNTTMTTITSKYGSYV